MPSLKREFPFLKKLPRPLAKQGISLDSNAEDLSQEYIEQALPDLVEHLLSKDRHLLREVAPSISRMGELPIAVSLRTKWVRTALSRVGVQTWEDLGDLTASEFKSISGIGPAAAREVLTALVKLLLSKELREARHRWRSKAVVGEITESIVDTLRLISTWASRARAPATTLGELVGCLEGGLQVPPDLERRWGHLLGTPLDALRIGYLASSNLGELAEELFESLEDTEWAVYERRLLVHPKRTLQEVGEELGFTRERARQLQLAAEQCVESLLCSRRYLPLRWYAWRLRASLGACAPRGDQETQRVLASALAGIRDDWRPKIEQFLLNLAGPYKERHGWLEATDVEGPPVDELMALADSDGLLPVSTAQGWLKGKGIASAFHSAWLERTGRFRREGDTLLRWSGSIADKSIALLALTGIPSDAQTLVDTVGEGHNVRSAQNAFLADDRMVRVNRSEWALRSWDLEEYSGITDEIAQRIEEAGGRVLLADVVEELVVQFGVKAASVRTYAEAPMFVNENGWVRLRTDDEPFSVSQEVAASGGVYVWGSDRVSVLVAVDGEVLRGSGRSFPSAAAAALGVLPGSPRDFSWESGSLPVTWPVTAALGPSLGSLRKLTTARGAQEGDAIRLDFRPARGTVTAELVPKGIRHLPRDEALALLTGLRSHDDPCAELASAVGASLLEVKMCLVERGDKVVADLLPTPDVDPSLESALAELADSLEGESP